jgi:hypothetical protein
MLGVKNAHPGEPAGPSQGDGDDRVRGALELVKQVWVSAAPCAQCKNVYYSEGASQKRRFGSG